MLLRRQALRAAAGLLAAGVLEPRPGHAGPDAVRISLPLTGSAGTVWRPLIEGLPSAARGDLALDWIGGNPGQVQFQLVAGTLNVSVFGALGLAEARAHGADIVIFGPALNNHGRWLVHADSPYQHPGDLIGKRIATQSEASETYKQARIAAEVAGLDIKRDMHFIFGPPAANQAVFERRDVEGLIALEPLATRLVARGAREIARVGDMWQAGTGETRPPFLVGLAADRSWVEANHDTAAHIARLFLAANRAVRDDPSRLSGLHEALGIHDDETKAIALLPSRMNTVYATEWDDQVFASIDRQLDIALRLGLIPARPARPLYDRAVLAA